MPVRPYLRRFARKFVFDVLPGALASVVGAMFFAQHWAQPPQPVRVDVAERVAVQSEQIAQMIRDEHALMVEFLKKEQERETARQPLSVKDMRAKEIAVAVPPRRPADPVREVRAPAPMPVSPAKPEVEVVALESGPLVAPEPQPRGAFARIAAVAAAWTDKAVDLTGLRLIPALIRGAQADMITGELDAATSGHFFSASR